jgi:hypothetical protein
MPLPRLGAPTVLLSTGRVLVPGGFRSVETDLQSDLTHVYDPLDDKWIACYPLGMPRWYHAGIGLPDGSALVAGGATTANEGLGPVTTAERFVPPTLGWMPTGAMNDNRSYFTATLLDSGLVLAAGGFLAGGTDSRTSCELYDPSTGLWQRTDDMLESRGGHAAARLDNGQVLVAGGTSAVAVRASAELFTP